MSLQPAHLSDKLAKLDGTQDSICNLSEYCRFFVQVSLASTARLAGSDGCRVKPCCICQSSEWPLQEAHKVVSLWDKDFDAATDTNKRLALLYLANDILQNSRKRGTQFVQPFYRVLPRAVKQTLRHDPKVLTPCTPVFASTCAVV